MANIVNYKTFGTNFGAVAGGFRHGAGLIPASSLSGDPHHASVRIFHVTAAAATAGLGVFRGDVVQFATANADPGADIIPNIVSQDPATAAAADVVQQGNAGSMLGNVGHAPDVTVINAGAAITGAGTTANIVGVVVGFGPISLYMAKNGFQYIPAGVEGWVYVDTDPNLEMYATFPAAAASGTPAATALLGSLQNLVAGAAPWRSTVFGTSGKVLTTAASVANGLVRVVSFGDQVGNDITAAVDATTKEGASVAKVMFNPALHFRSGFGVGT